MQTFDISKDMLVLSNAAYGLGVAGLSGSGTVALGGLLSSATDGSFSSSAALFAYNVANGVVFYRSSATAGAVAVAVFENHPVTVSAALFVGV